MAGLSRNSPAFDSMEKGIPGGNPNASSRRLSIQSRDVSRSRPRGVTANSFMLSYRFAHGGCATGETFIRQGNGPPMEDSLAPWE